MTDRFEIGQMCH